MSVLKNRIRVLIADEQPVVRFGLRNLFKDDPALVLVGEIADLTELERSVHETQPDIVLVDPGSDNPQGMEILRRICGTQTIVVIYTSRADQAQIMTYLELGVCGYLLKQSSMETLLQDIHSASEGKSVLSPVVASALVEHIRHQSRGLNADKSPELTARELQVLNSLVMGMSNRAIADKLNICEATVKFHVRAILEKLQAGNRTEAVKIALKHKLVEL
jgi:NarL family two-component system response regulator LiaR